MYCVCVIGSATIDTNVTNGARVRKIGGVATYAGITFLECGLSTLIVANVAHNDRQYFDLRTPPGLTWTFGQTPATTQFTNYNDANGRRQAMPSRAAPIGPAQVRAAVRSSGHIHLGPLHPLDIDPSGIEQLVGSDALISLDVQGYLRKTEAGIVSPSVSNRLEAALSAAHLIKADASEMAAMLAHFATDALGLLRRFAIREAVITAGRTGGQVLLADGAVVPYEAQPVPHVSDPTGAGDVFFAVYLAQRHHAGAAVAEACAHAAETAARQVAGDFISESLLRLS